jgi:subtilisin-like proprotein convertase family protein
MTPRCRRVRPSVEALEDRSLPSSALPADTSACADLLTAQVATPTGAPYVLSANLLKPSANSLGGARVTLDHSINAATFTAAAVTLTGPGGRSIPVSVRPVAGSFDRTFDIVCTTQTAPGTYSLRVGGGVTDFARRPLQVFEARYVLAATVVQPPPVTPSVPPVTATNPGTFASASPTRIAANSTSVALLSVNQDVRIQHVQVKVDITFPRDTDLVIHLQAPNGTDLLLAKHVGGTGQNFQNTLFDDAGDWSLLGHAPFNGTYQPTAPLSKLNGTSAAGTWKLWVENRGSNTGTINSFSVIVNRS